MGVLSYLSCCILRRVNCDAHGGGDWLVVSGVERVRISKKGETKTI